MLQLSTTIAGLIGGGAYVMVILDEHGLPVVLAVLVGLAAGAVAHGVIGFLMVRYLAEGSEEVKAAVTVTL
ncbi:MAG: branched-chain amino acid ABC transporter permease, partial [Actinobacteria bacterium]|nr:branched-chain amino acid ABC transporter permease [Actinomycetota bacterium]